MNLIRDRSGNNILNLQPHRPGANEASNPEVSDVNIQTILLYLHYVA